MANHSNNIYNIIPIHNLLTDHPSLRYPEVRAATSSLHATSDLRKPPCIVPWDPHYDLLDWLGFFFGFQRDNVHNQREHLVLHLANAQMRVTPQPDCIEALHSPMLRHFHKQILRNYTRWCSYLGRRSSIWIKDSHARGGEDDRRELLYVGLYLLIWGECANLRFAPECICFIFHHMAFELNRVLEDYIDENTGGAFLPSTMGEYGFLNLVVKPIYDTISKEVEKSMNGTAPHCVWRNYDDINEYFWSRRCFDRLKWPIDLGSTFFVVSGRKKHVGKTGFVEQRSFWNLFRSFDRLWVMLVLFFQAELMIAWKEKGYPWKVLKSRDEQVKMLTLFLTWSLMRFFQSLLDFGTQYSLISRETWWVSFRMVLKSVVSAVWAMIFGGLYSRIWVQRHRDKGWSNAANQKIILFLEVAAVFCIPEILSLALFIIPWVRSCLEKTNWRICYMLTWWFQTRTFVGRGLKEGLVDNVKYSLFWIVVLTTKFCFSYFLQIKPMICPTKALLGMKYIDFRHSNRFAVGFLWIPVVLIYLMDLQIWYAIYSSLVGATIGLFSHLGEIRNMQQLRLRFQFFASAIQFNLMSEEELLNTGGIENRFKDAIHRLKLRYGLGKPIKKLESNKFEENKLAMIWNEIITTFREEDVISDKEVELLELPQNSWSVRVIRWPCVLLCNELLLALGQAKEIVDASDKRLWHKISKYEYRRCAVIEAYDSVKYFLMKITKQGTEEHTMVTSLFQELDHSIKIEKLSKTYNLSVLPKIHGNLISLFELLIQPKQDLVKVVNALQALYETIIRDFYIDKRNMEKLREDGLAPQSSTGKNLLFIAAIDLPSADDEDLYRQLRRLHVILDSRDSMHNVPKNLEARRRLAFFSNSLFMKMPHAPQVEKMRAFSVLTPYYCKVNKYYSTF